MPTSAKTSKDASAAAAAAAGAKADGDEGTVDSVKKSEGGIAAAATSAASASEAPPSSSSRVVGFVSVPSTADERLRRKMRTNGGGGGGEGGAAARTTTNSATSSRPGATAVAAAASSSSSTTADERLRRKMASEGGGGGGGAPTSTSSSSSDRARAARPGSVAFSSGSDDRLRRKMVSGGAASASSYSASSASSSSRSVSSADSSSRAVGAFSSGADERIRQKSARGAAAAAKAAASSASSSSRSVSSAASAAASSSSGKAGSFSASSTSADDGLRRKMASSSSRSVSSADSTDSSRAAAAGARTPAAVDPRERQKLVSAIIRDASLTEEDKRARIRAVMSGGVAAAASAAAAANASSEEKREEKEDAASAAAAAPLDPRERQKLVSAIIKDASLKEDEKRARIRAVMSGKAAAAASASDSHEEKKEEAAAASTAAAAAPLDPRERQRLVSAIIKDASLKEDEKRARIRAVMAGKALPPPPTTATAKSPLPDDGAKAARKAPPAAAAAAKAAGAPRETTAEGRPASSPPPPASSSSARATSRPGAAAFSSAFADVRLRRKAAQGDPSSSNLRSPRPPSSARSTPGNRAVGPKRATASNPISPVGAAPSTAASSMEERIRRKILTQGGGGSGGGAASSSSARRAAASDYDDDDASRAPSQPEVATKPGAAASSSFIGERLRRKAAEGKAAEGAAAARGASSSSSGAKDDETSSRRSDDASSSAARSTPRNRATGGGGGGGGRAGAAPSSSSAADDRLRTKLSLAEAERGDASSSSARSPPRNLATGGGGGRVGAVPSSSTSADDRLRTKLTRAATERRNASPPRERARPKRATMDMVIPSAAAGVGAASSSYSSDADDRIRRKILAAGGASTGHRAAAATSDASSGASNAEPPRPASKPGAVASSSFIDKRIRSKVAQGAAASSSDLARSPSRGNGGGGGGAPPSPSGAGGAVPPSCARVGAVSSADADTPTSADERIRLKIAGANYTAPRSSAVVVAAAARDGGGGGTAAIEKERHPTPGDRRRGAEEGTAEFSTRRSSELLSVHPSSVLDGNDGAEAKVFEFAFVDKDSNEGDAPKNRKPKRIDSADLMRTSATSDTSGLSEDLMQAHCPTYKPKQTDPTRSSANSDTSDSLEYSSQRKLRMGSMESINEDNDPYGQSGRGRRGDPAADDLRSLGQSHRSAVSDRSDRSAHSRESDRERRLRSKLDQAGAPSGREGPPAQDGRAVARTKEDAAEAARRRKIEEALSTMDRYAENAPPREESRKEEGRFDCEEEKKDNGKMGRGYKEDEVQFRTSIELMSNFRGEMDYEDMNVKAGYYDDNGADFNKSEEYEHHFTADAAVGYHEKGLVEGSVEGYDAKVMNQEVALETYLAPGEQDYNIVECANIAVLKPEDLEEQPVFDKRKKVGYTIALAVIGASIATGLGVGISFMTNRAPPPCLPKINWETVGTKVTQDVLRSGAELASKAVLGRQFGADVSLSSDGSRVAATGWFASDGVAVYEMDATTQGWAQLGGDIAFNDTMFLKDEDEKQFNSSALVLSGDGQRLAVGRPFFSDDEADRRGMVIVYEYNDNDGDGNGGTWNPLGTPILGPKRSSMFGAAKTVDISEDGSILAIGDLHHKKQTGRVLVYKLVSRDWVEMGGAIQALNPGDRFGVSISLSADGTTLAAGAVRYNDYAGQVRVFRYSEEEGAEETEEEGTQEIGGNWAQVGEGIEGDLNRCEFGWPVVISPDGNRIVANSATFVEENGSCHPDDMDYIFFRGQVKVFEYAEESWAQVGSDIVPNEDDTNFGESLSLSGDGSVLAVSAWLEDTLYKMGGVTRVYHYDDSDWIRVGNDVTGNEITAETTGFAVSLSYDGDVLAAGAPDNSEEESGQGGFYVFNRTSTC